jgi:hypothetical protein
VDGLLLTDTQRDHLEKGRRLFFSPEAVSLRSDPELSRIQELAALDHFMRGWKNLTPRYGTKEVTIVNPVTQEIIRRGNNELPGYDLAVDDDISVDDLERVQQELAETRRFMESGEVPNSYSSMLPEEIEYLKQALLNNISGKAIDKVGESGTKNRQYAKDDPDTERRGKVIPAIFKEGQKRERGTNLALGSMENIDKDTGVGLHGNPRDALHRQSATNAPELLTDTKNIRMGNSSLNQSVKHFEGDELDRSLKTRLLRLQEELFLLENGIPAKQRGGIDTRTNAENLAFTKLMNNLDKQLADTRMAGEAMDQDMMRQYLESGEDLQATGQVVGQKPIVVNADEGANVYVHTNSNGNGNGHAALQREFNRRQRR